MQLHIANITRFRTELNYRVQTAAPGSSLDTRRHGVRNVVLNPRSSTVLPEMTHDEVMFVIEQIKRAGGIMIEEAKKVPRQNTVYLMSIDKPITATMMQDIHRHNVVLKTEEGAERRKIAALGVNTMVEQQITAQVKAVDIEMEQMDPFVDSGREPEGKVIAEGFHIDKTAPEKPTKGRKGGRR